MKIQIVIDVPDGDTCEGCDLWYRAENKICYCLAFGMKQLEGRYKTNMVHDMENLKCSECQTSKVIRISIPMIK